MQKTIIIIILLTTSYFLLNKPIPSGQLVIKGYQEFNHIEVKNNKGIGIIVEENSTLILTNSTITNNVKGIYVKKGGKLIIINSVIAFNKEEGIDLRENTTALIQGNQIYLNGESGIETETDGVDVVVKNNWIKYNLTRGVAVQYRRGIGGEVVLINNDISMNWKSNLKCVATNGGLNMEKDFYPYFEKNLKFGKVNRQNCDNML